MKRNFPDFITQYLNYSRDEWCPEQFHLWMGASLIGAALERKVWLTIDKRQLYPNIYVMLISQPGIGKSSAINPGLDLIRRVRYQDSAVNVLADQTSEASFYDQMALRKTFISGGLELKQCSGYLALSEASNSLKDMVGGGSIIGSLTHFYDCDPHWSKQTKSSGKLTLENICCNLIAGCTFDHLRDMIPERSLNGGFASRLLYVVIDDRISRRPKWTGEARGDMKTKLVEDLQQIHNLTGPFQATNEFKENWASWIEKIEDYRQGLKSGKMQALLARKATNVEKLAMIICVSESNEMTLTVRHWEKAVVMYESLEKKFGKVLTAAYDRDDPSTAMNSVIQFLASPASQANLAGIKKHLIVKGMDATRAELLVKSLLDARMIESFKVVGGQPGYKLLIDPNNYL